MKYKEAKKYVLSVYPNAVAVYDSFDPYWTIVKLPDKDNMQKNKKYFVLSGFGFIYRHTQISDWEQTLAIAWNSAKIRLEQEIIEKLEK